MPRSLLVPVQTHVPLSADAREVATLYDRLPFPKRTIARDTIKELARLTRLRSRRGRGRNCARPLVGEFRR